MNSMEMLPTDDAERTAWVMQPYQGETFWVFGHPAVLKASAEDTDGQYSLFELIVPPDNGSPRHVHRLQDKAYYVMEGEMTFAVGQTTVIGTPGTFIHVPRGMAHQFYNRTGDNVRMLTMMTPGGIEQFYAEISALGDENLTMQDVREIARRFDIELADQVA